MDVDGRPPFAPEELPSYLLPTSPHVAILPTYREHYQILEQDPNSCVLLNTFDGLEEAAIRDMKAHVNLITVGPLFRSNDAEVRCDLFDRSGDDYLQWLDTKADSSVVYVSFGSLVVLKRGQIEEILHGLVESGLPVLWVIRKSGSEGDEETLQNLINSTLKKEQGLIVPWCSQVEVLSHKSVGCFVTHCGWNSTIESLAAGVPIVGCPHFADQSTNANLVEELWGTGVRARVNAEGVYEHDEIKRCLEIVIGDGERGEEIRRNAQKWKGLAMEAVKEGGSSDDNLRNLVRTQKVGLKRVVDTCPTIDDFIKKKQETVDGGCTKAIEDELTCSVCLDQFNTGELIRSLPCLHQFHASCIDPWLRQQGTFPVCKYRAGSGWQENGKGSAMILLTWFDCSLGN